MAFELESNGTACLAAARKAGRLFDDRTRSAVSFRNYMQGDLHDPAGWEGLRNGDCSEDALRCGQPGVHGCGPAKSGGGVFDLLIHDVDMCLPPVRQTAGAVLRGGPGGFANRASIF
jgi:hypothetical protein